MSFFEVKDIHKRFGHQVVLERINLKFEKNKLSGIMGPNGAGKTTCFNVLTGKYKPNRGQIFFKDEDITSLTEHQIADKKISRSFQIINVFNDYTVLQNVLVAIPELRKKALHLLKDIYTDAALIEKAYEILKKINLEEYANESALNLSYGQRRALEIGIALATEPEILFLDEPTQGLGTEQTVSLAKLIASIKDQLTIVIIEHDMHFLFGLADKISVIHWGQVITEGTPDELKNNKWVKSSMLGDV